MFLEIRRSGFLPDGLTMVSVMSACGSIGNLDLDVQLHKYVFQARGLENCDVLMGNSAIDMYGKCGRMDQAYQIFSRMEERNVSSWTSMIVGYATHGHPAEALECFHCMRETTLRPNYITFIGMLNACVHGGMVREGKYYFDMLQDVYRIEPRMQHYGCMVDLLGRAGLLNEAREMVESMPMSANIVMLGCPMGACEKYRNVKMGEWVAKQIHELEPKNDELYVVLANIYARNGMWEEVERMRSVLKERELAKMQGVVNFLGRVSILDQNTQAFLMLMTALLQSPISCRFFTDPVCYTANWLDSCRGCSGSRQSLGRSINGKVLMDCRFLDQETLILSGVTSRIRWPFMLRALGTSGEIRPIDALERSQASLVNHVQRSETQ